MRREREGGRGEGEKERASERAHFHLLILSACSSQGWGELQPRARDSIQVCPVGGRAQYLNHYLVPPTVCISKELDLEVELRFEPRHSYMGCTLPAASLLLGPSPTQPLKLG